MRYAQVSLVENPSTGYRWDVATTGVSIASDTFHVSDPNMVGGGGVRHLTFLCLDNVFDIKLALRRPWMPAEVVETHHVLLEVP